MRCNRSIFIALIFCLLIFGVSAQVSTSVDQKVYLPGDFVHVIVDAPVDTTQISAVMPDGTIVNLIQGRRANLWRGIWQVPVDFGKGTYRAKLSAVDVRGNIFDGETNPFAIGELAVIAITRRVTPEIVERPPLREKIEVKTQPAAKQPGVEEIVSRILKVIPIVSAEPAPSLEKEQKKQLIAKNLGTGRELFDQGKYLEASAYFKIVLYLDPKNGEANLYLLQTKEFMKTQQTGAARFYILLAVIVSIGGALIAAIVYYFGRMLWCRFPRWAAKPAAPAAVSDQETIPLSFGKLGWTKNPFTPGASSQMFNENNALARPGLIGFIKARIEEAGGKGLTPFTDSALDKIFELSKGRPKEALKICEWTVDLAIRRNSGQVTAESVKEYEKIGLKRILIADDDEIVRISLDAILRSGGGYETDFAVDGEEAVKKIKSSLYGLVLLDIDMPKMNGYEVLEQIRPILPTLPVIFVTGKGTPARTLESLTKQNLTGYIEKPFTPEKILDIIARNLKT
ncbi:MAG: response regulator [Candidatus Margulisiibacteriota bacterium]